MAWSEDDIAREAARAKNEASFARWANSVPPSERPQNAVYGR